MLQTPQVKGRDSQMGFLNRGPIISIKYKPTGSIKLEMKSKRWKMYIYHATGVAT